MRRFSVVTLILGFTLLITTAGFGASSLINGSKIKKGTIPFNRLSSNAQKMVVGKTAVGVDGINGANGTNGVDGKSGADSTVPGPAGKDGTGVGTMCNGAPVIVPVVTCQGSNGTNGTNGVTPTFDPTPNVATLAPGANATVAVQQSGGPNNYAITLGIPRGDIGPAGPAGSNSGTMCNGQVVTTPVATCPGTIGPKGDTGATGPKGDKGDTGAQGIPGPAGGTSSPVSQAFTVANTGGLEDSKSVACATGNPIGGGYSTSNDTIAVRGTHPTSDGWAIEYKATANGAILTVYVVCLTAG